MLDNDTLLAAIYVNPMYQVTLTNDQQDEGRKALAAITLSMKEYKERNSRADEVDQSQSFSKDESSTSGSDNEDIEKHPSSRQTRKNGKQNSD